MSSTCFLLWFPVFIITAATTIHFLACSCRSSPQSHETFHNLPRSARTSSRMIPQRQTEMSPSPRFNHHESFVDIDDEHAWTNAAEHISTSIQSHVSSPPGCNYGSSSSHDDRIPIMGRSTSSRYCTAALSLADRYYLSENHRPLWTVQNAVAYHETRKALVPAVMNNLDKINTYAKIEHDLQQSRNALNKNIRKPEGQAFPHSCNLRSSACSSEAHQTSQSMYKPTHRPHDRPRPDQTQLLKTKFSFDDLPRADLSWNFNHRASKDGFIPSSVSRTQLPEAEFAGGPNSDRGLITHRSHDPEITFDSFLVPHKSGKGEVFRGSKNAKKETTDSDISDPSKKKNPCSNIFGSRGRTWSKRT